MGVHLNRLARPRQRSLSLRTRLLIAGGLNVALLLVIAAGALWQLDAMRRQFGRVVEVHGRHASLAHQLKAAQLEWTERLRALLVVNDPGDLQAMLSSLQAARQRYLEAESALDSELQGEEEANITLRQPLRELQQVREQIASVYEAAARSLQGGSGIEGALALLLPAEAAEARWRQQIGDIVEVTSRASQAEFSDGIAGQRRASYGVSAAMSAAVLIALVMGWSLARSITRPVAEAVGAAEAIANGWLDEPIAVVQRDDEFGRLAAAMTEMRSRRNQTFVGNGAWCESGDQCRKPRPLCAYRAGGHQATGIQRRRAGPGPDRRGKSGVCESGPQHGRWCSPRCPSRRRGGRQVARTDAAHRRCLSQDRRDC